LLVTERAAAVSGIDGKHQPVEEASAVAAWSGEQGVHRRCQPQHPEPVEEIVRRGRDGIDADPAAGLRIALPSGCPGADLGAAGAAIEPDMDRKAGAAAVPRD